MLNQLQGTLDHPEVKDTWFDNLTLVIESTKGTRRMPQDSTQEKNKIKLELSGRYLVRASEEELSATDEEKRNTLIDLNSQKQEASNCLSKWSLGGGKNREKSIFHRGKRRLIWQIFHPL